MNEDISDVQDNSPYEDRLDRNLLRVEAQGNFDEPPQTFNKVSIFAHAGDKTEKPSIRISRKVSADRFPD